MLNVRSRKTGFVRYFGGKCDIVGCPCMATEEVYAFDDEYCLGAIGQSCSLDSPMLNRQHPGWLAIAKSALYTPSEACQSYD